MTISVLSAGLQTTVQAQPRCGLRHYGVPASGPADPLSMALANQLVGNTAFAPALEATLTGPTLRFESASAVALTGGAAEASLAGNVVPLHETLYANAGDELCIGAVESGVRVYVAVAGGFDVERPLGSGSTYLPAGLGGHEGRALEVGDRLSVAATAMPAASRTPDRFRPPITSRWAIRVCRSAETHRLADGQRGALFDSNWIIGRRADRMGLQLEGPSMDVESDGRMASAPVFPGTLQCPEDGVPFLLGVDAQTTGGYPRIAQIARADRHLLGQMRPGDHLRFLPRQPQDAIDELRAKCAYWRSWLPEIDSVL